MSRTASIHPTFPPEPKPSGCIGTIAYAVLFVAGTTILYAFFWEPFRNLIAARNWAPTPSVIISSKVESVGDKNYRPDVKYKYQYDGKPHRSERIWFLRWGADSYSDAKAVVNRYPPGSLHTAYVNPRNPEIAVLERGFRPQLLIALFPLALTLIGVIGLSTRVYRRVGTPDPRFRPIHHHPPGTAITRHGTSGWPPLVAALIFAGIWNFGISFLVREVASNWRDGIPGCYGWFLTLFSLPFILVGAGVIILAFYLFLKLFNPRPALTLAPAEAPLGGSAELTWHFTGRFDRIHRLRISLEGREEATYNSGDDTSTAREVFMTVPMIDTSKQIEIRGGKARVQVPINAMPTFTAPHNRIAWAVRFCGEIRGWPDVDEEFEFVVLPALQPQIEPAGAAAS